MSESLIEILTHEVQYAALAIMTVVYIVRVLWLFKFPATSEFTPARGSHAAGITHAMIDIALPWQIGSYRNKPIRWFEFVALHVAVAVAIAASIVKPETDPSLGASHTLWVDVGWLALACQGVCALGVLAGISRTLRRFARPEMRIISSPDDYFSIILLDVWLLCAVVALQASAPVWSTVAFFTMTTFFLLYVPFSKICHYLYYPFNKFYVGRHLGHRGVYPRGARIVVQSDK